MQERRGVSPWVCRAAARQAEGGVQPELRGGRLSAARGGERVRDGAPVRIVAPTPREVDRHSSAEQGRAALVVVEEEFLPWAEDRMRGRQGHFQAWGKDERVRVDQIPNIIWSQSYRVSW